jgi:hypothetical protein
MDLRICEKADGAQTAVAGSDFVVRTDLTFGRLPGRRGDNFLPPVGRGRARDLPFTAGNTGLPSVSKELRTERQENATQVEPARPGDGREKREECFPFIRCRVRVATIGFPRIVL